MTHQNAPQPKKKQAQQKSPYYAFLKDKQLFFTALSKKNDPAQFSPQNDAEKVQSDLFFAINEANKKQERGKERNYRTSTENHRWIEPEYNHLMSILKKYDDEHSAIVKQLKQIDDEMEKNKELADDALIQQQITLKEALEKSEAVRQQLSQSRLLCLYYACSLLINARGYGYNKDAQIKQYENDISYLCLSYKQITPKEKIPDTWQQQLLNDLNALADTPEHLSKVRSWVGLANAYRLLIVFSRLSWQQSIALARESEWFKQLENMGVHFNAERLNVPNNLFNVLSVGLFFSRFLMNASMVLKHTFAPTDAEKGITASERFWRELEKRHWILVNDLVWTIINGLSNFAKYVHLAAPAANGLLVGFLVFDALWLGWRYYVAEQAYFAKKAQYDDESSRIDRALRLCNKTLEKLGPDDDAKKTTLEAKLQMLKNKQFVLNEQMQQLDIHRYETTWTTMFNISAALLLMAGFTAAIILSSPAIVPVCFLLCTIAIAMYLSADKFGAYMKASLVYQRDQDNLLVSAKPEATNDAWTAFVLSMVENTFIPVLIMGLFAVSWPAALTFTLLYVAWACTRGYFNDSGKRADELLLEENQNEDDVIAQKP